LPDAELVVAGALAESHAELDAPGVRLLGAVSDLRPLYDAARVFVAPTRYAAGVPIKVLEAVGAETAVSSPALIADQLGWTGGREISVADDRDTFAEAAVALHQSADRWHAQRDAATRRVAAEHGAEMFKDGISTLLGDGRNAAAYHETASEDYNSDHPVVSVVVLNWNKSRMTLQ